jgi:hypothetical protein
VSVKCVEGKKWGLREILLYLNTWSCYRPNRSGEACEIWHVDRGELPEQTTHRVVFQGGKLRIAVTVGKYAFVCMFVCVCVEKLSF